MNKTFARQLGRAFVYGANQRGGFLPIVALLLGVILVSVVVSYNMLQNSDRGTVDTTSNMQAVNIARGGLLDTISWFRRQTPPLVTTFSPVAVDPYTSLPDSQDPSIGMVKESRLDQNGTLWARYEVPKAGPYAARDISQTRILDSTPGSGQAWYFESLGYVFSRRDASQPFNVAPNRVLARARVSTEIIRMKVELPTPAAVITPDITKVTIGPRGKIIGGPGAAGIGYYGPVGGDADVDSDGDLPAVGKQFIPASTPPRPLSPPVIFGVSQRLFRAMADINAENVSELPNPYPKMAIVYINRDVTFDQARPLVGSGILFVNGDLKIETDSNSYFNGLIYVTGDVEIIAPANVVGAVVAEGGVKIYAENLGDVAQIQYDGAGIQAIAKQIGQYRENKSAALTWTKDNK